MKKQMLIPTLLSLILAPLICTILMISVYLIPVDMIRENATESIPVFQKEGDNYVWGPGIGTELDGFTDSIILNNAAFLGTGSAVYDAMMNQYVTYEDAGENFSDNLIVALDNNDLQGAAVINYPRYWHGYLVIIKPLMVFLNYQQLRIANFIIQILLLVFTLRLLICKTGMKVAIPFAISIIFINPVSTALSLQYTCIYIITLLTIDGVLLSKDIYNRSWFIFLWSGIMVAFFDFLTYPIVALGLPLIIAVMALDDTDLRRQLYMVLRNSIFWGLGYGFMWASKWVIADILTDSNIITEAINYVFIWTGGDQGTNYALQAVAERLSRVSSGTITKALLGLAVVVIVLVVVVLLGRKKYHFVYDPRMISVGLVSLYPFVWYAIVQRHSIVHSWITYRDLAIFIMGILCIILMGIKRNTMHNQLHIPGQDAIVKKCSQILKIIEKSQNKRELLMQPFSAWKSVWKNRSSVYKTLASKQTYYLIIPICG